MNTPNKVSQSGLCRDVRLTLNRLIEYVQANTVRPTESVRVNRTAQGTQLRVEGGKGEVKVTDDTWY